MPTNLKLAGLKTFVAPFTGTILIKKGEVIRVSDQIAAKLEEGGRNNSEGEFVPYWVEPGANDAVTYDFSGVPAAAAPAVVRQTPVATENVEESAPPATAKRTVARQRGGAAKNS